jgi:transcriptional antiterminator Rof (Rho-off)
MMNKYVPIPCEIYGKYELAILRRTQLRICWRSRGDLVRIDSAVPINIRSRSEGEFIVVQNRRKEYHVIRLDRIIRVTPLRTKNSRALCYS